MNVVYNCKAILFDWDGTLVNSLSLKIGNARQVFHKFLDCDESAVEVAYQRYSGIPRRELFNAIVTTLGRERLDDDIYERISVEFSKLNSETIRPNHVFREVTTTLTDLRRHQLKLVVSSSATSDDVQNIAQAVGLADFFDHVWGSDGNCGKGSGHVMVLCELYGLRPANIIMVGDEEADLRLARKSGVTFIAKIGTLSREEWLQLAPDGLVNEVSGLLNLIR